MISCKQVSNALAKGDYMDLPKHKRMALRVHIALCAVCGKFNGNIMRFQDISRAYRKQEETAGAPAPESAKKRFADSISQAISKS